MKQLNVLADFLSVIEENCILLHGAKSGTIRQIQVGHIHCATCGRPSRVSLRAVPPRIEFAHRQRPFTASLVTPSVHLMTCLQCSTLFTALLFAGPQGTELAVFPSKPGGLATKNTPAAVGYYLDQAWRCQSVGALSAAVVMYRSALEHLLREQGYAKGNLYERIEKVGADADAKTGPDWVRSTPQEILHALRELGNGAVHTNDGDISKQATFDAGLLAILNVVIRGLLEEVYERGERNKAIQAELGEAAKVFKKAQGS